MLSGHLVSHSEDVTFARAAGKHPLWHVHRLTTVHFDVGDEIFDGTDRPAMLFGHRL